MKEQYAFIKNLQHQAAINKWLLLVIVVLLFIPHWLYFYQHINDSIEPDLLLRTIGSRLQEAGKPIYEYKWKTGDQVSLLNPYQDPRIGLNGVVSTPFLLWLLQPFANLSYCSIRIIWSCTQEIFLFVTMWLCSCTFHRRLPQIVFIIVAVLFFVYDRNWLLNVYNGQMYVIYAFIFALSGYCLTRFKNERIIAVLYILLSLIRPFFITAIVPFFRFKKQFILYFGASAAIAILIIVAATTAEEWKQYNNAMKLYAKEETGELAMNNIAPRLNWHYADACTKERQAAFTAFGAGCLYSLQHYLYLAGISVSNLIIYQVILLVSLLIVWLFAYKKGWLQNPDKQLLLSFLFYQLCELITPASRNPYNMVQWLPAAAWLIASGNKKIIALIVTGLCLNHDIPFWFKYEREIGEGLLFAAVILFLFKKNNRSINWDSSKVNSI